MRLEKEKIFTKPIMVVLLAVFACLLWGSAFPCVKIGYQYLGIYSQDITTQILFAGIRFFIAGILIVIIGSITEKRFIYPSLKALPKVGALAVIQTIVQYVFFYIALANTSGVNGSIINGSNNFLAILIACCFKQEKINLKKIIGCLFGFAGVIIASIAQGSIGGFTILGEGFMFISAIACAFGNVFVKKFAEKENPVMLTGYQFALGGLLMIIVTVSMGARLDVSQYKGFLILAYLSMLSAIAYTIWVILLKYNSMSKVAIFGFVTPVAGSLMSALFLSENEIFDWRYVVALVLVSIGIFIVNFVIKKKKNNET